jgi:hypothetical protein
MVFPMKIDGIQGKKKPLPEGSSSDSGPTIFIFYPPEIIFKKIPGPIFFFVIYFFYSNKPW